MNFGQKWTQHLKENNMSYIQHLKFAFHHGIRCLKAGLLLVCHGVMPAVFQKAGSNLINELNQSFLEHNEYIKWKRENNV